MVLCIGSAVLDITARNIDKEEVWQEKQRIESIHFTIGGDAANQSIRMADAGLESSILSAIGADQNGTMIRSALQERGVNTDLLLTKEEYPTGTALLLLTKQGERTIFSVRGAYCELDRNDVELLDLSKYEALSIAGLFTEPRLEADGGLAALLTKAREQQILTFADLASDKLHQGIAGIQPFLPLLDFFLPSLSDVRLMTGLEAPEDNARRLRELGSRCVILKCGSRGCYISSDEFEGWVRAAQVSPVDTTGAGDCMVALFISEILRGANIEESCRFACAGATMSTLYKGASAKKLKRDAILAWMEERQL